MLLQNGFTFNSNILQLLLFWQLELKFINQYSLYKYLTQDILYQIIRRHLLIGHDISLFLNYFIFNRLDLLNQDIINQLIIYNHIEIFDKLYNSKMINFIKNKNMDYYCNVYLSSKQIIINSLKYFNNFNNNLLKYFNFTDKFKHKSNKKILKYCLSKQKQKISKKLIREAVILFTGLYYLNHKLLSYKIYDINLLNIIYNYLDYNYCRINLAKEINKIEF
jgi:hypothetical protein